MDDYPDDYVEYLSQRWDGVRILDPGEPAPGQYENGVWKGPLEWRTRRGPAIIGWRSGHPDYVWNASLTEGRRVKAAPGWLVGGWRRRADRPPLKYQWGHIDIREDDVVFTDGPNPTYVPPQGDGDEPNIAFDVANDADFVAELRDIRFAIAAWHMLYHADGWMKANSEVGGYLGRDGSAALVAGMRGLGEDAPDFKFWDVPPGEPDAETLFRRAKAHFHRLGWRLTSDGKTADDYRRERSQHP
jgi:hypothetical protein